MMTSMGYLLPGVFAVAIMFGPGPDSTLTKLPGYGGVLPVPFVTDDASALLSPTETIAPRHTERKAGRVLYANDRAPKAPQAEPVRTAKAAKRTAAPCNPTLLQSRTAAQPNS